MIPARGLLLSLLLLLGGASHAQSIDRRIAVTIDDLPWQQAVISTPAQVAVWHPRLIAQLRKARVPIIGFVNESQLEIDGRVSPARVAMLGDWLDAGFELGNHPTRRLGRCGIRIVSAPAPTPLPRC